MDYGFFKAFEAFAEAVTGKLDVIEQKVDDLGRKFDALEADRNTLMNLTQDVRAQTEALRNAIPK